MHHLRIGTTILILVALTSLNNNDHHVECRIKAEISLSLGGTALHDGIELKLAAEH